MNRTSSILAALFAALLLTTSALVLARLSDISSAPRPDRPSITVRPPADAPTLRIGVVSRFAPNVIFAVYQPLIDHLNRQGGHHYELKLSGSYLEAVEDLKAERVAASFLGAWIYGPMASDPDLIPLVAPLNTEGVPAFRVALVTGPEGAVTGIADLRGRRVALPSPQSWSGNWLQTAALPAHGLSAADLDSLHHFDHHQTVAREVMRGAFDAGVVKQTVCEKYRDQGLRVLEWSDPIP
ncbi:PhnD/SsuA/transferrin family substrate-binding protein, partial [bacterium]|nr:PhnD/SsuA/transferrin family substrate-binding protein [bacterium]